MDKTTRASKGFGFDKMSKAGEAIKALNNQVVDGEKIRVKYAVERVAPVETK